MSKAQCGLDGLPSFGCFAGGRGGALVVCFSLRIGAFSGLGVQAFLFLSFYVLFFLEGGGLWVLAEAVIASNRSKAILC